MKEQRTQTSSVYSISLPFRRLQSDVMHNTAEVLSSGSVKKERFMKYDCVALFQKHASGFYVCRTMYVKNTAKRKLKFEPIK